MIIPFMASIIGNLHQFSINIGHLQENCYWSWWEKWLVEVLGCSFCCRKPQRRHQSLFIGYNLIIACQTSVLQLFYSRWSGYHRHFQGWHQAVSEIWPKEPMCQDFNRRSSCFPSSSQFHQWAWHFWCFKTLQDGMFFKLYNCIIKHVKSDNNNPTSSILSDLILSLTF